MARIVNFFKRMNAAAFGLFVAMVIMLALNIFAFLVPALTQGEEFHKVMDGSTAPVVLDRATGQRVASLHVGEAVNLQATRCNNSKQLINVNFAYLWHLVEDDSDLRLPALSGTLPRSPGCNTAETEINMPASVADVTRARFAEGDKEVEWRIEGVETAVHPQGEVGPVRYWETQTFKVLPDEG